MTDHIDSLYAKLPSIYRIRDAEQGNTLRALLRVIEEQADIIDDDLSRMYDNWFIETCEDWIVPYIGDLVGYLPLHNTGEPARRGSARDADRTRILIPRRDVANTIRYRRRKGTLALLELLADDVADWPARAVEFYRLLGWTQALNHLHPARGQTTSIRYVDRLERIDGPFDATAHTMDVRRIGSARTPGRFNIPEVGVFACRLRSYPVTMTMAHHHDTMVLAHHDETGRKSGSKKKRAVHGNYTFSVLGNDAPLFTRPERETDPRHIAEEINLPVPIRRRALENRKGKGKGKDHKYATVSPVYYGPEKSMAIWVLGWPPTRESIKGPPRLLPAESVIVADLSEWRYDVPPNHVAVDPVLGRFRFPAASKQPSKVFVRYHYGFSADIGGGEYFRPIPGPDIKAISAFRGRELKNTEQFAAKLAAANDQNDPVSAYIRNSLAEDTQKELTKAGSPDLAGLLARDLSALLADEAFYTPERFRNIGLKSSELTDLLAQKPDRDRIVRRNRLLLEAAYPDFIPTSFLMYRVGGREEYRNIVAAIGAWYNDGPVHAVIEITDGGVYSDPISITLEPYQNLYVRAANAKRPVIRLLDIEASAQDYFSITGGEGSRLVLDGLLITGRSVLISGPDDVNDTAGNTEDLCEVVFRHCTLVPGWSIDSDSCPEHGEEPSIELDKTRTQVRIEKSIVGSIMVTADAVRAEPNRIRIRDSIVDATGSELDAISTTDSNIAHAALSFERCTVLGKVSVHSIRHASDSIFTGNVMVARTQEGCMRFCYIPDGSHTPRKFRCMPDSLIAKEGIKDEEKDAILQRVRPSFTSRCYGKPGYCQLAGSCPVEIREGAEDESEMGVFNDLYQPQREANLRLRLSEYTPAGMESGIIFVN